MFDILRGPALLLMGLLMALPAHAQDGNFAFGGDVFSAGNQLGFSTEIAGDAFAAGNTLNFSAATEGDVHAVGNALNLSSAVGGNVYAMGNNLVISGGVGADVSALANTLDISGAGVTGNIRAGASAITINGPIGGNVLAGGEAFTLNAPVTGDVRVAANRIEFGDAARISGTLHITSASDVEVPAGVIPADRITFERVEDTDNPVENVVPPVARPFWVPILFGLIGLLVLGAIWLALFPNRIAVAYRTLLKKPVASIGWGVLALALVIGLVPVFAITLIGIFLVPVAMVLLALAILIGYIAGVYFLASRLFTALGWPLEGYGRKLAVLLAGLVIGLLVWLVPFVSWFVQLLILFAGLGAMALAALGRRFGSELHRELAAQADS